MLTHDGWVAAIADGVGGNAGGDLAAEAAILAVEKGIELSQRPEEIFEGACDLIAAQADAFPKMATTLSVVSVRDGQAQIAHVGDTRVYHVRGNGIVTRTEDQTELSKLLREKVLTPSQAKSYPRRNVIFSYLSASKNFDLFRTSFQVRSGDHILLLTDGVYDIIKKSEIVTEINSEGDVEKHSKYFEALLKKTGTKDDSTMVSIKL